MAWDEPESLKNDKLVSPWEIIPLSSTPPIQIHEVVPPPPKKFRADEGDLFYRMAGFSDHPPTMAQVDRSLLSYDITYPAGGMQGARHHDLLSAPNFPNFSNNTNNSSSFPHHPYMANNTVQPRFRTMPTEINIWGPQSEDLSPDSQRSILSSVTNSSGTPPNCNTLVLNNEAAGSSSIRLFGTTIQEEKPGTGGDDNGTQ